MEIKKNPDEFAAIWKDGARVREIVERIREKFPGTRFFVNDLGAMRIVAPPGFGPAVYEYLQTQEKSLILSRRPDLSQ